MTGSADLERRYRRLLAFYPKAFRERHEQEILSVLMTAAAAGQRRPRVAESADLLWNALLARLHQMRLHPSWDYKQVMRRSLAIEERHPLRSILVRVAVGVWLLILAAIAWGEGYWWGVLLLAPAALHFYLAYRLLHRRASL